VTVRLARPTRRATQACAVVGRGVLGLGAISRILNVVSPPCIHSPHRAVLAWLEMYALQLQVNAQVRLPRFPGSIVRGALASCPCWRRPRREEQLQPANTSACALPCLRHAVLRHAAQT